MSRQPLPDARVACCHRGNIVGLWQMVTLINGLQAGGLGLNPGWGFPGGSEFKASACNVGDLGLILGREDPLEKEMATCSSILAWRIPWTEEPSGLQSMGSQRVGHD